MKLIFNIFVLLATAFAWSQSTQNPNTGNAYLLFGPNSTWGQYFQVGGNGRVTTNAGIFATNGNLHLDSKDGAFSTYINYYSKGNTLMNAQGGKVGVGTTNPRSVMDVGKILAVGELGTVMARLSEGNGDGEGTFLGVRAFNTQGPNIMDIKSFSLEHSFYGNVNSSINCYRGGSVTGGYLTFNTQENIERMRIATDGNIGIGTNSPDSKLTVKGKIHAEEVKVDLSVPGPDYVFKDDYELRSLEEIQKFIKENGHLPNIPSAKEMEEHGVELGIMNMKLLEKIEELTLYALKQDFEIKSLKSEITILKDTAEEIEAIKERLIKIENTN